MAVYRSSRRHRKIRGRRRAPGTFTRLHSYLRDKLRTGR